MDNDVDFFGSRDVVGHVLYTISYGFSIPANTLYAKGFRYVVMCEFRVQYKNYVL